MEHYIVFDRHYIIVDVSNARPLGMDRGSGGYPYYAYSPNDIQFWKNEDDAEKYMKMFQGQYDNQLQVVSIVMSDGIQREN